MNFLAMLTFLRISADLVIRCHIFICIVYHIFNFLDMPQMILKTFFFKNTSQYFVRLFVQYAKVIL